jgi:hypothetical protein
LTNVPRPMEHHQPILAHKLLDRSTDRIAANAMLVGSCVAARPRAARLRLDERPPARVSAWPSGSALVRDTPDTRRMCLGLSRVLRNVGSTAEPRWSRLLPALGFTWPRGGECMAKSKTKDLEVRLKVATAALVLLEVLARLLEMVVHMFHQ